jgi:CRISPR-associated protein Csb2
MHSTTAADETSRLAITGAHFDELLYAAAHPRENATLPLTAAVLVADALRGAMMAKWNVSLFGPIPEVLSGHTPDRAPTAHPHVAFVALTDLTVTTSARVTGVALVLPTAVDTAQRNAIARTFERVQVLTLGSAGACELRHDAHTRAVQHAADWRATAKRWASVTPVVFDRFPDVPEGPEAEAIIAGSCERVGLPRPARVIISGLSLHHGVSPSRQFQVRARRAGPPRVIRHVLVEFRDAVPGPVLIGAGRFLGLGLLHPWDERAR